MKYTCMGQQQSECYNIPHIGGHEVNIGRIVPAVAKDGSFTGIRIESFVGSSPNTINHVMFSTAQHFSPTNIQTETIAFDSYNLNYLVSFTTSLRTMVVSFRNGTTRQNPLAVTLDDPIHCKNIAGPVSHYVICLAGDGFSPVMINVTSGTSKVIPVGDSPVAKLETLSENTFYLLNTHQELLFYMITNTNIVHIGTYTVSSNSNFRLMGFTSNITCNVNHTITNNTVQTKPSNQTGVNKHTGNLSNDTENADEIEPTNTINETSPNVNTSLTDITGTSTGAISHPNISGNSNNLQFRSAQL